MVDIVRDGLNTLRLFLRCRLPMISAMSGSVGGTSGTEAGGSCVRCWKSSGASVLRKEAYLIDDLNVVRTDRSISSLNSHDGQYQMCDREEEWSGERMRGR